MTTSVNRAERLFLFNKGSDNNVKLAVVIEAYNSSSQLHSFLLKGLQVLLLSICGGKCISDLLP